METILIVCQYRFPEGDAGSVRMYNFAKTLMSLGYRVLIIGMGPVGKGFQQYKGIRYLSLRQTNPYNSYFGFSSRLIDLIKRLRKKWSLHTIILGTTSINVFTVLKKYCNRNDIVLIKDVVEWYSPSQFKWGRLSLSYFMKDIENRFIIDKTIRVISISTYLEKYFLNKQIHTERIPIYFDQSEYTKKKEEPVQSLNLLYAGFPSKQDNLYLPLKGLSLLDDQSLNRLHFVIIGVSLYRVKQLFSLQEETLKRIMPSLEILGRVPRSVVLKNLLKSDFTVLLRDNQERYAQAGFPSKVIESISNSTPVIMNFSSDIGMYFTDNENCIKVKDYSEMAFADSLRRALLLTESEKKSMSRNAKELAIRSFDKYSYIKQFEILLK